MQAADTVDVFLIVGAGGDDVTGRFGEDAFDCGGGGAGDGGVLVGHHGVDFEQVANFDFEIRAIGFYAMKNICDFSFDRNDIFFDEEAAVDDDTAAVGDNGRGQGGVAGRGLWLAAVDGIDVEGGGFRPVGDHGHGGMFAGEEWF